LFSGPTYRETPMRLLGAFLFAVLACALLVEPLGSAMVLQGEGRLVYEFVNENRVYIVTSGLILALLDLLGVHTARRSRAGKH